MPPTTKGAGDFKRTLEKFIQDGASDAYLVPTDLGRVVAFYVLHTLCLGIHAQFALGAVWWYVEMMKHPALPGRHQRMNLEQLAVNYREWAEDMRPQHPAIQITTLGEFNQDVIGSKTSPALMAKTHETLTLLGWTTVLLQLDALKALEHGPQWATAAQYLWIMWQAMDDVPMVVPRPVCKDRRVNKFAIAKHRKG